MVVGFALTLVVKIARRHFEIGLPIWVMDSLPNFICAAVIPFVLLTGRRAVRRVEFLSFCGLVVLGLVVYELLQIAMPKRTFQVNDLIASAVGALLSVSLGWIFFRRKMQVHEQSHAL
jgi:VanZ family protein